MTKDAKGCQFEVEAYYGSVIDWNGSKPIRDCDFYAMGLHAKTLDDLKTLVAKR